MVGWYHRLNGHEFEQVSGDSEGQGCLVCFSPWGRKESDIAEGLNNNVIELLKVVGLNAIKSVRHFLPGPFEEGVERDRNWPQKKCWTMAFRQTKNNLGQNSGLQKERGLEKE